MGTPAYMAPEQAMGRIDMIDRWTDVYSLGATFYHVLGGQPPFVGGTGLEVLMLLMESDPRDLHRLAPAVPVDLAAIIMRCLEKEPRYRYESARALAEDLQRFLDGEPVEARPAGPLTRMLKAARRNRRAVSVAGVALAVVVALVSYGSWMWWQARQREALAQEFGLVVRDIEWTMKAAHLSPVHDITPERERVLAGMAWLEARLRDAGPHAEGPGHYALGRGELALRDLDAALEHLQQAWDAGYQTPEAAHALGLTLGGLYERELDALEALGTEHERERRRQEVAEKYRDPAVRYLRTVEEADEHSDKLIEARIALYEERYDDALAAVREGTADVPWEYEAGLVQGQVLISQGLDHYRDGEYEPALARLDEAGAVLQATLVVAPSDPYVQSAECSRRSWLLWVLDRHGDPLEPHLGQAVAVCETGTQIDPGYAEPWATISSLHRVHALYALEHGEELEPIVQACVDAGERAAELDPGQVDGLVHAAAAWKILADARVQRGGDPQEAWDQAIGFSERVLQATPRRPSAHNNIANVYIARAGYERRNGRDGNPDQERAAASLERAIEIQPDSPDYRLGLGVIHHMRARAMRDAGEDPRQAFEAAAAAYDQAIGLDPHLIQATTNLGMAHRDMARYEQSQGRDPLPWLERAEATFRQGIASDPDFANAHNSLGWTARNRGDYLMRVGQDPTDSFVSALEAFRAAQGINEKSPTYREGECLLYATWAMYHQHEGRDPHDQVELAQEACTKALELNPRRAPAFAFAAEARRVEALYRFDQGHDPRPQLDAARQGLEKAIEIKPDSAQNQYVLALVELGLARYQLQEGLDAVPAIRRGLELTSRVLEVDANDSTARCARAGLLLAQAEAGDGDPQALRTEAQAIRDEVFAAHPDQKWEFGGMLDPIGPT